MVVSDHDTLRHLLKQPNDMLTKRHARYVRVLWAFTIKHDVYGLRTARDQGTSLTL
jgi:hypothetical protein